MKSFAKMFAIFALTLIFLMGSCTVTKRVHRNGWHVDWHKKQQAQKTVHSIEETDLDSQNLVEEEAMVVETQDLSSVDNEQMVFVENRVKQFISKPMIAKVLELANSEKVKPLAKNTQSQNTKISRSKEKNEKADTPKSEEAKEYLRIGRNLLIFGTLVLLGAILIYSRILSTQEANAANPVKEVSSVIFGSIVSFILLLIAITLLVFGFIFLIRGIVTSAIVKHQKNNTI
jgi:hypothetical protein|tara:strand:- start:78499 stop:79191 length:693 start_codon:yes stop_codon:yes gene_type:complete